MNDTALDITLYGRAGCHLCDDVERSIRRIGREIPLTLHIVDIHSDPALLEAYMFTIPVVAINGEQVFVSIESVVTEWELREELEKRVKGTRS